MSHTMEMENLSKDTSLREDKALAEALLGMGALAELNKAQKMEEPAFFEQQSAAILNKLTPHQKALPKTIGYWSRIAIAASFLGLVTCTYFLTTNNQPKNTNAVLVKMDEIPSSEIENYINEIELIAEVDWAGEINEEATHLDASGININLQKDSNLPE